MMAMAEMWASLGSAMASIMFVWAMYQNYFPPELRGYIRTYKEKVRSFIYPYIQIIFPEYQGDGFERTSKAFMAIERYLDKNSMKQSKRLRANVVQDCELIVLSMQDAEQVTDEYQGIKLWWASSKHTPIRQSISFYPREEEKRYFKLTFHKKHRDIITKMYLRHVLDQGKAITVSQRQRKLYTNNKSDDRFSYYYKRTMWSSVVFEHPSTFDTLAMEPDRKQEIIDDLITFSKAKDYYAKIGKAWKRGYLLYGPPGTGKSSMIAAMANFMNYDVYDLELTSVKDNTELRKLLIDTSSKAVIVIEDIDCSLDLTGQRKKKKKKDVEEKEGKDPVEKKKKELEDKKSSQVTLSGLLNFIDGLWSACGSERLIVFTTNFVEKLDPALIRRGRMDKHIELSYCRFEAFKVLAKNYLDIESHHLFSQIGHLLEETDVTPADVAENLMPKAAGEGADICLERLIKAIEQAKEDARLKAEEEAKRKAEEEETLRAEKEEKQKQKEDDSEEKSSETMAKEVKEDNSEEKSSETLTKEVKKNGEIES